MAAAFTRLFDILRYQHERYPREVCLSYHSEDTWKTFSTGRSIELVDQLSTGLLHLGLKKGDKVAILSQQGSAWWILFDMAMLQAGIIVVPIHASTSPYQMEYILRECEAPCCIVPGKDSYHRVAALQPSLPHLKHIVSIKKTAGVTGRTELLQAPREPYRQTLETTRDAIGEHDLATIIYTSGTTGEPKGVMLSHANMVSNILSILALLPLDLRHRAMSFLPLTHVFERMVAYTYLAMGVSLYFVEPDHIQHHVRHIRPNYFSCVPRFLEKLYEAIQETALRKNWLARKILAWSVRLGEHYSIKDKPGAGQWLLLKIADFLVYRHWRAALGGKVEGVVVGAAALQPRLARLFSAAGIDIREGYGLTETSPVISFNRFEPGGVIFGTVGIPIPGVEVKIEEPNEDGEGEILVKGPNVMLGYYNKPEETAQVLDADGWFHTGDIGKFVFKKFLQITDRKKDIFKTTTGRYVSPQTVENRLKTSPFIEQCMVVGANKPYVAALIIPSFRHLEQWCNDNNVHWTGPQFMVINPKVEAMMSDLVEAINEEAPRHERVRKFKLLHREWTTETSELTPTLKIRRAVIANHYRQEIEDLYAS